MWSQRCYRCTILLDLNLCPLFLFKTRRSEMRYPYPELLACKQMKAARGLEETMRPPPKRAMYVKNFCSPINSPTWAWGVGYQTTSPCNPRGYENRAEVSIDESHSMAFLSAMPIWGWKQRKYSEVPMIYLLICLFIPVFMHSFIYQGTQSKWSCMWQWYLFPQRSGGW